MVSKQSNPIVNKETILDHKAQDGNSFPLVAALWRGYFKKRFKINLQLTDEDVLTMVTLMKVSRVAYSPKEYDTADDILKYVWIGLNDEQYVNN